MTDLKGKHVAVVGGGWAGCAAAWAATQAGASVSLIEAGRVLGGRARRMLVGEQVLDNGQHILIGAYTQTLALLAQLGVDEAQAFLRIPMQLKRMNGDGLQADAALRQFPRLCMAQAVLKAQGWTVADKLSLARVALRWELARFACGPEQTALQVCKGMTARVLQSLIEPLCVSALNIPAERASGAVFLRVLRDALFAQAGGSDFLLPRQDLSALLPERIARHLHAVHLGARVVQLNQTTRGWKLTEGDQQVHADAVVDAVVLATPPIEAARLVNHVNAGWSATVHGLRHEAIATVYAQAPAGFALPSALIALDSDSQNPAQFVFDRAHLGGAPGVLAFVVSASVGDMLSLSTALLAQGRRALGVPLSLIKTVVEKRATFACTPGLVRPPAAIAPGLVAAGDFVDGPYPATLEGAVRSGLAAVELLKVG